MLMLFQYYLPASDYRCMLHPPPTTHDPEATRSESPSSSIGTESEQDVRCRRDGMWFLRRAILAVTLAVVVWVGLSRVFWACSVPWQCDEIPLLYRFTGLCGHVTNEVEAAEFEPSFYSFYMGALRGVRAPTYFAAIHTTTNLWTNLFVHLMGCRPIAGRLMPLMWSMVAIALAGYSVWLVRRSLPAVCIAALLVALSPSASVQGAQTRGYSEAMALTPLLILVIEYFRRRPGSWFAAVAVLGCALHLSLTVLTAWVYWVFPTLVLSSLAVPQAMPAGSSRRYGRAVLWVVTLGMCAFMAMFIVDRWVYVSFFTDQAGVRLDSARGVLRFLSQLGSVVYGPGVWLLPFAIWGGVLLWRSPVRWWLGPIAAGVMVPAAMFVIGGSGGYVRNFLYLLVPGAVLMALGADEVIRQMARAWRARLVLGAATVAGVGLLTWAVATHEQRVRGIIEPDWGQAILNLDRDPGSVGPRFICPCLADMHTINWYHPRQVQYETLSNSDYQQIEVVMGAQYLSKPYPVIFVSDAAGKTIIRIPVPEYIADSTDSERMSGVEIWRWRGMRRSLDQLAESREDTPVLVALELKTVANHLEMWVRLVSKVENLQNQVATYMPTGCDRICWPIIVPSGKVARIVEVLCQYPGIAADQFHFFELLPLQASGPDAEVASRVVLTSGR